MTRLMTRLIAALALFAALAVPLEAKEKRKKRPAPIVSPVIHEDRSVTFSVQAPNANEVSVTGEMTSGAVPMTRGENDIWSVTLDPVDPGLYSYSLRIDGFRMIDPGNPSTNVKASRAPRNSHLHIPGDAPFDF